MLVEKVGVKMGVHVGLPKTKGSKRRGRGQRPRNTKRERVYFSKATTQHNHTLVNDIRVWPSNAGQPLLQSILQYCIGPTQHTKNNKQEKKKKKRKPRCTHADNRMSSIHQNMRTQYVQKEQ